MNREYIKVKDKPHLVRDKKSNAILNVDDAAFNKYKKEREEILRKNQEHEQMKSDISEIKTLLTKLLEQK